MTALKQPVAPPLITYERYLAEGEINQRYDILDGVRISMAGPSEQHQDTTFTIATLLKQYERMSGSGKMIMTPRDILITRSPLRTRQPDVMFISSARHAQNPPRNEAVPMSVAPELVVEVLSPSDTTRVLDDKMRDYCRVGVQECWVVSLDTETVEALRLSAEGYETAAVYGRGEEIQSLTFPDLRISVDAMFAL